MLPLEPNLTFDRYGIYFWTRRFCASVMWPLRHWALRRQRGPDKYHGGNISFGPFYLAWYDRTATYTEAEQEWQEFLASCNNLKSNKS